MLFWGHCWIMHSNKDVISTELLYFMLKEPYWIVLNDRIVSVISSATLTSDTEWVGYPFQLFDFTACHQSYCEMYCSYVLALAHAVWHHSSIGQLSLIPKYVIEVYISLLLKFCLLVYNALKM